MATTIKDRTRLDSSPALVGTVIDKYEIVGVVGKGGMGCVYEAINTSINKRVAIKCIDGELAKNAEANARFRREALAASSVDSSHIVQIFDAGVTQSGLPYIVMELLRGRDLGAYLSEHGPLEAAEALPIVAQVLKGLSQAHDAGIVHRDLKPDNVFLVQRQDEPVKVKLLDFGVSKIARPDADIPVKTLTRQGTVVGTPFYMAPEQAQAFPDADHRADLYSVGAILFECLTGKPPHEGRAYEQVIVNICMHDAPDVRERAPNVPAAVAELVDKALRREREDRFQSAREMLVALKERSPVSIDVAASGPRPAVDLDQARPANTPLVVSGSLVDAEGELADTVGVGDTPVGAEAVLRESGVRPSEERPSADDDPVEVPESPNYRWLAAVPIALLIAIVAWIQASRTSATEPESGVADVDGTMGAVPPPEAAPAEEPASAPATAEATTAEPSESAAKVEPDGPWKDDGGAGAPVAKAAPKPPGAPAPKVVVKMAPPPVTKPPVHTDPTPPTPPPAPAPPSLQLQTQ